ncbi:MAG TPA: hypothetical protein VK622_15870, partial [Puia sp.]|nr:hypothetical protein [Puia sp.]
NHLVSLSYFSALIMEGIWFSAIYNSHHYVLDVLAGIGCGITGIIVFAQIQKRIPFFLSLDQNTNSVQQSSNQKAL